MKSNPHPIDWKFSDRASQLQSSFIREILKITQRPEIISFAGGLPSPLTFPVERMQASFDKVLSEHGKVALQYGPTDGYAFMRSTGNVAGDGRPPANEIMSGRCVIFRISRMNELCSWLARSEKCHWIGLGLMFMLVSSRRCRLVAVCSGGLDKPAAVRQR